VGLGLTAFLLGLFTMVYMAIMRRVGVREKISGS
jgi:hypothetical protein